MSLGYQFGTDHAHEFVEARRHPRYKLEIEAQVYPRNAPVIRGRTVDISQSGISIMLRDEVAIGEVVRLEFALPLADIDVHAVARQRNAFRYGFEFVDPISAEHAIGRTCRQLAIEQAIVPER